MAEISCGEGRAPVAGKEFMGEVASFCRSEGLVSEADFTLYLQCKKDADCYVSDHSDLLKRVHTPPYLIKLLPAYAEMFFGFFPNEMLRAQKTICIDPPKSRSENLFRDMSGSISFTYSTDTGWLSGDGSRKCFSYTDHSQLERDIANKAMPDPEYVKPTMTTGNSASVGKPGCAGTIAGASYPLSPLMHKYVHGCMNESPMADAKRLRTDDDERPALPADLKGAAEYCELMGGKLPTEEQWRKAAGDPSKLTEEQKEALFDGGAVNFLKSGFFCVYPAEAKSK